MAQPHGPGTLGPVRGREGPGQRRGCSQRFKVRREVSSSGLWLEEGGTQNLLRKCGKEMMNRASNFHANKMTENLNKNQVMTCIVWGPVNEASCTPLRLKVLGCPRRFRHGRNPSASRRLADALKLQDQMALPTKALPEGAKRKVGPGRAPPSPRAPPRRRRSGSSLLQLSFALSILGSPAVLLLDEPTTGMDPEGQLQMW